MSWNGKPLWFEGMFMHPQHLQQFDRYIDYLVDHRAQPLQPYGWGFSALSIDRDLLGQGRIALTECRAVMRDGTVIDMPDNDSKPAPCNVSDSAAGKRVMLAIPIRRKGDQEVVTEASTDGLAARFVARDVDTPDITDRDNAPVAIRIGQLNARLALEDEDLAEYVTLPICRIREVNANGVITLSTSYMPPMLDCSAAPVFVDLMNEIGGMLRNRGDTLSERVGGVGQQNALSDVLDFVMLQFVNRYDQWFAHLAAQTGLHPHALFLACLQLAAELATFRSGRRRPDAAPAYVQDDLESSFAPLIMRIREGLSIVTERAAVPLPLEERAYGIRVSPISDRSLTREASFVIAAAADLAPEQVRQSLPANIKVGPVEDIREFVNYQLPGIQIQPMSVVPRALPYRSGYTYFELVKDNDIWPKLDSSAAFAFHVSGAFPGLKLEFWAIRDSG